jgi:hypothetical protein
VITRGAVFLKTEMGFSGELVIFRDITREKKVARNNEAMRRISMALPEYPDLVDLLNYISNEVKGLLGTEGALVTLLDEGRDCCSFGLRYPSTSRKYHPCQKPLICLRDPSNFPTCLDPCLP